jgi:pantoate--beta-alanine ligase
VREADGLAMSSRNAYLSAENRASAAVLPRAMNATVATVRGGADYASALAELQQALLAGGFASIDYAEIRDENSLAPLTGPDQGMPRLFVAARIGATRLIDNVPL